MKLAFVLFKYFPHGGLQRDFKHIAAACVARGHRVVAFTMEWSGPPLAGVEVELIPAAGWFNHWRYAAFERMVSARLATGGFDAVVGFNKMAGLDLYYAADPCYLAKVSRNYRGWYRFTGRFRHFAAAERAVCGADSHTMILLIAPQARAEFQAHHSTPEHRFFLLPPGISRDRLAPANAAELRAGLRREFGLASEQRLLLMIGSGFITKGVDRALRLVAALPDRWRERIRLIAIGQDNPRRFLRLARRLGVEGSFTILPGRDDIPRFLLGADLLIHPAYSENTGTVLLEALAAGLPVVASGVCGYAGHIRAARGGVVLGEPFDQEELNRTVINLLDDEGLARDLGANGLAYARTHDLYGMPESAATIIETVAGRSSCS